MRGLTLTTKEQTRIQVLNGVIEGKVSVVQSAKLMGVSERHTWRLLAAYREEGAAAVAHGNRGRKPATTTSPRTQQKVMELAKGPICRTQPYPSDRDAGRARGCPSVTLHREADTAGGRACRAPIAAELPSATDGGSATRRRGCCCRSMGAATTGLRVGERI